MAVTKNSDVNSKKTVEEGAEPSCMETADSGAGDVRKDACGKSKSYRPKRNRSKDHLGRLSDIDDAEISMYFNTKEEINLKRILWEAMNGTCTKAKKQKRITETKIVKKDAKANGKPEVERRSSRINYDALKLLNDEWEQNAEMAAITRADSCVNTPHGSISHGSSKSSYREDERGDDTGYHSEDNQTFDQHLTDEYIDFL